MRVFYCSPLSDLIAELGKKGFSAKAITHILWSVYHERVTLGQVQYHLRINDVMLQGYRSGNSDEAQAVIAELRTQIRPRKDGIKRWRVS